MKKLINLLLVSLILLFAACKKDTQTDAQLICSRLQDVIKNEAIVRVIPASDYSPGGGTVVYSPGYGKNYQFNPPFIVIEASSYNVLNIKRYYTSYVDNERTLFLVF